MKMSGGFRLLCASVYLLTRAALSSGSRYRRLGSVEDLIAVYSEKSLPMHSLVLLHWFANNTDADTDDVVRLSFDPREDFGSDYYDNYEGLLAPVPSGYLYYTVGNLNPPTGNVRPVAQDFQDFPPYVRDAPVLDYADMRNRDRIIVQEQTDGSHRVGRMYLTQQHRQGSRYDPDHTFEISPDLLRTLALFSFSRNNPPSLQELRDQFEQNIDETQLNDIVEIWGRDQAPLGLLLLIVTPQRANLMGLCGTKGPRVRTLAADVADDWQNCQRQLTQLDVTDGDNGTTNVEWKNIPQNQLGDGAAVVLLQKQTNQEARCTFAQVNSSQERRDTSEPTNEGLEVRSSKTQGYLIWMKEEMFRFQTFERLNAAVHIHGYGAKLQLGVRKGYACFILYIRKEYNDWKSDFYYSWVGLYQSAKDETHDYFTWQWQWVTYFDQIMDSDDYETYLQCTGTKVSTGFQARFMIYGYFEKAQTPFWL